MAEDHQVSEKELPHYVECVISIFNHLSYTFSNIALLKMKNNINADIKTDDWPEFQCTVVKLPISKMLYMIVFLSKSPESFKKLLFTTKFNEISIFLGFDQQTYSFFEGLITPWSSGFTKSTVSNYKSFHFPGKIEDLPSWPCPKGTFTARLQINHAYFINELWNFLEPHDRLKYLKYLIENCISAGLFLEADSSQPVSWALVSNYGHIIHLYTVEEHRRKGYAGVTMLYLMLQMLKANMTPVAEIEVKNTPSIKLHTKLGFVDPFDITWILYS